MLTPPTHIMVILAQFAQVFSERTWDWVQVLAVGAILAPGKRTVTSVLTAVGLSQETQYQRYHRVLNVGQSLQNETKRNVAKKWREER